MSFKKFAFLLLPAIIVAACATGPTYVYYRVSSKYVSSAQAQQTPEIIPTPAYNQLAGSARTVAVRAPDRCSNNTTNQATGNAASAGAIMQTDCGVEMGEIERSLTRAGYNVISWTILDREMSRTGSPVDAASALGAQVLFQINSLENSRKTLGQDALWERSYYVSNAQGAVGQPLSLPPDQRALVARNYLAPIEAQNVPRAYAVTLDAVAVWVRTGQSIWYYRWTHARAPDEVASGYSVLLACMDGVLTQCQANQLRRATALAPGQSAAGETVAVSVSERPEDAERAVYAALYKEVVGDFVTSFSKNAASGRPAPTLQTW
ncbi:hypothetical protein [Iodidimonas sp. SYSU 1G8]|uniref:hypothetical protein n=1 Tax=Iodidimonas sp. SYSU 1G8 TaxID=3133967 RepID=UPI0031FEEF2E